MVITVLKLGEKANPKLAKIITLSSNIEITDLRKLKKLSDDILKMSDTVSQNKPYDILVTGSTGFIGKKLLAQII